MNRLTNEQRVQIIEFYYQNACSVKKVHRVLLPIVYVLLLFIVSLTTEATIRTIVTKFAPNLHCWTLNHQHAYVECELKKISELYRPVLMMTINYQFIAVRSN